ncbi:gamma-glutamyl-gamma-aminobutyrate hydrolase family protein [Pseudonocardia spinosispora]|uniref:gamma-glutamyl-gamma-aminobutyrate hydrolase family protein n=1 Tax=Pseudonocardia spinosispora TaxID=103441 RepID=UPI00041E8FEA|nr:gamma-glutamyl-gamma-aminobutyrate hydrolase family protein [Pseudonocardia spinosispora]
MTGGGPVVGITVGREGRNLVLDRCYVDSVVAAGGTPLLLPAVEGGLLVPLVDRLDALLLTGGGDVRPELYGEEPRATLEDTDPVRDDVELRLFRRARTRGIRVLGVCRGAQLMAVATGGRLVQDLPAAGYQVHLNASHDRAPGDLRHCVKAEPGSLAETVLVGASEINSHHHQAIAEPGSVLTATAWAPDGTIEAVEGPGLLGVQWHPEIDHSLPVFSWLTSAREGSRR